MNRSLSLPPPILAVLLSLLVNSNGTLAADTNSPPPIDPKAVERVQKMSDFFVGLKSMTVKATMTESMEANGRKAESSSAFTVAMQRPNQFSLVIDDKQANMNLVCDGQKIYLLVPPMRQYIVTNAPTAMDGVFDEEYDGMQGGVVYAFMN